MIYLFYMAKSFDHVHLFNSIQSQMERTALCDEVTRILKYYFIFVYILQGKMGKTGKNRKKITQLKSLKYQNPKDENMGWKKHLQLKFHSLIRRLTRGRSKSRPICTKLQIPTTIISSALNSYTFLIVAEWTKKALISH